MKKTVLFCTGLSGSGKSSFIEKHVPLDTCYKLKSATTRPIRDGEQDGREYYFRDENYFDTTPMATHLWVNQAFWQPGMPKWLYGVPEFEIRNHMDKNLIYDVIQPKYVRQMIDWFRAHGMQRQYSFKVLYFIAPSNSMTIARTRANMPNDIQVRQQNTCDPIDFLRADLNIDFLVKSSAEETIISTHLNKFLHNLSKIR